MGAVSDSPGRVAVVVAGAGARGGDEACVSSVLVPAPLPRGCAEPDVRRHQRWRDQRDDLRRPGPPATGRAGATGAADLAQDHRFRRVPVPDRRVSRHRPARVSGQLLHIPGLQFTHLLDTEPLRRTAERVIDWNQLRDNIASRRATLAVVATSGADNRSVVFVDGGLATPVPPPDDQRPIDYVAAHITAEHVLGSSAIPIRLPACACSASPNPGTAGISTAESA